MLYPLDPYKLTLPVDADGNFSGKAAEILQPSLKSYQSRWFTQPAGSYAFSCPDGGAKTATAHLARCELRNMRNWSIRDTVKDTPYTFAVTSIGPEQSVIVGQIHDQNEPWFMLTYEQHASGDQLWAMMHETDGAPHTHKLLKSNMKTGDKTTVQIRFVSAIPIFRKQRIEIVVDDVKTNIPMNRKGNSDPWYFKRGNYNQSGAGIGAVATVVHYG